MKKAMHYRPAAIKPPVQFTMRVSPGIFGQLKRKAKEDNTSINDIANRILEDHYGQ